jgi:hypothetical protein
VGFFFTIFPLFLINSLGDFPEPGSYRIRPLVVAAFVGLCFSIVGGAFGLLWPESKWRWGVWMGAAPICLVSFVAPDAGFFAGFVAATLAPSCACAYAAARLHLRYTEAG